MYHVVQVPPLSRRKISQRAQEIRTMLKISTPYFPVMDVVEFVLPLLNDEFELEVWSRAEMDLAYGEGTHAMTFPDEMRMILREDVYRGARKDAGRDRFTVAHELGHLALHRLSGLAKRLPTEVLAFENSEWQADAFAGALLMPAELVAQCASDG